MDANVVPCLAPLLILIFPVGVLFFRWLEGRKERTHASGRLASDPYRSPPPDHVWRFVKVHAGSAWSCMTCGAGLHDDCDAMNHCPLEEWPVWAT